MPSPLVWPLLHIEQASEDVLSGLTAEGRAYVEKSAVEYLHLWTGGLYGLREAVLRPCWTESTLPPSMARPAFSGMWREALVGGVWRKLSCDSCPGEGCYCHRLGALRFGFRVEKVTEVLIDGQALPGNLWRLEAHRLLYRTDRQPWPSAQDMTRETTEPGTWAVALEYGTPAPTGGQIAAGLLAVEIARALVSDPGCKLPQRLQTITRQGVTMTMIDSMDSVAEGRTGIWLVDSWIASVTQAPTHTPVWSPDAPTPHHRGQ